MRASRILIRSASSSPPISMQSPPANRDWGDVVTPEGAVGREGANDVMFRSLAESGPAPAARSGRPPVAQAAAGRVEERTLIDTRLIAGNSLANAGRILST